MAEEEIPDWLKPSTPSETLVEEEPLQEDTPEWLRPTSEVPPPPTPVVPEDELDDSYWGRFTKWSQPIVDPTVRAGVRSAEDLYNASQEFLFFGEKAKWEDEWLGKPESAVEDIAAEMGSWVVGFVGPGGLVQKGVSTVANIPKVSSKTTKLLGLIGKTKKGEKALQVGKIAAEGAVKGAVADYLTTDVGDLEADEAIQKRLSSTVEGGILGAGVNVTTFGAGRLASAQYRRLKALRKIKRAAEGKADPTSALKELKASIDEETAIKEDFLSDIKPTDDRVDPTQTVDDLLEETAPPKVKKPEVTPKVEEPAKPTVNPELEIEEYIKQGQSLPEQVNRLVRLNVALDGQMNPKINALVQSLSDFDSKIEQGIRKGLTDQFNNVKKGVVDLETDLRRYRKMIELRARAGNLSGKLLLAFKGIDKMDFNKPIKYKPAVQKQLESIDRLLDLVGGVKGGKLTNEKLLGNLKRELGSADQLAKTGDLKGAVEKEFDSVVDENVDSIWGKYKNRISEQVLKTLRLSKDTNKAALDMFSDTVTKNLKDAVAPSKPIVKKLNQTLDNLQDILSNPEKYKESIDVIIKDISEATELDPSAAANATRILNDLKNGVQGKRFLEALPQRGKLVQKVLKEEVKNITAKIKEAVKNGTEKQLVEDVISDISNRITNLGYQEKQVLIEMVRAELGNTVATIREKIVGDFISKEIYQKYSLKHSIEEMDEMADKSIAEIKEYLGVTAKKSQIVPEDIKRLKEQAKASKKILTDKLKQEETAAYNEFVKEFLQSLSKMDSFGMEEIGNFELFLRASEKFRLNSLLFSVRTWTVGLLSAGFNMGYQPFKQMLKKYSEIKELQKLRMPGYGPEVSAMKVALQELTATSEYINNWSDLMNILKATWRQNGHGAFNAKAFRRHEEDLISKTDEVGAIKESPIKLNFKNKEHLQKLVNKYGVDSEPNKTRLRKFLEEIVEGEPSTRIGKALDPLFSVSFRAMGMFDQPFVFLGTMRALRSDALQQGLIKGLEGEALEKFTKERMQEALKREGDVLTWAKNEEFNEISELGFSMVYQQEYADKVISKAARDFARWSRSGEDSYRNPLKIGARLFVPFIKTPTAIAQWTVDNLPLLSQFNWARVNLGLSKTARTLKEVEKNIRANTESLKAKPITKEQIKEIEDAQESLLQQKQELILKNTEEKAEAAANAISSSVLGVGITTAISTGNITGSGAHLSDDQKARLRDAGWKPNTIYIGGHKIDYSRFEPFSTLVSAHADLVHYLMLSEEGLTNDDLEWYNVLRASFVSNFSDKYFLRGLKSFFGLLDKRAGDFNAESVAVDFLSSLSPTIIRDLNQMNQEFQTKAHGFRDKLMERSFGKFPGLFARNLLGEKVERQWQMEGAWGVLSPVYFAKDDRDTLMTEIANIREDVGGRQSFYRTETQKIDTRDYRDPKTGISLQDKWMDEMSSIRISGKTLRKSLEKLIKTKKYKDAPNFEVTDAPHTRASLVKDILDKYRNKAWKEVRKDRKLRKYTNAEGNSWIDILTGEVSLIQNPKGKVSGIADISLPNQ